MHYSAVQVQKGTTMKNTPIFLALDFQDLLSLITTYLPEHAVYSAPY